METVRHKVLVIEDDKVDQMAFRRFVKENNIPYDYTIAGSVAEAKAILASKSFDIIIVDYLLGDGTAFDIFDLEIDAPLIVTTGSGDEEVAVKAMQVGASDYLIKDPENNYLTVLPATVKNAISQKRAEVALQESEERYSTFFKTSRDPVFITSAEGRWQDMNDAAVELLGYESKDDLFKVSVPDLYENLEERRRHTKIIDQEGFSKEFPVNLRRKDGRIINTLITSVARKDEDGNVIGYQGTIRDITEHKRAEEALRTAHEVLEIRVKERTVELVNVNEQLKQEITERKEMGEKLLKTERLAAIGEFSSGIAHELRQPLGVISNSVYFLGTRLKDVEEEKVKKHLAILEKVVKNANRLISDLLDFARVDTLVFKECDVNQAVEEALSSVEIRANIEVKTELKEDLPPIQADFDQLMRVCLNIISNAVSAMPEGGSLSLKTDENKRDGHIEISIADTGEGIPAENMQKIFEPLFTTKARGIGLGLALCKKYVAAYGGKIEVESEVGKGTKFTVKLPTHPINE